MNGRKGGSAFRWRGVMADADARIRLAGIIVLAITAVTMVATQLNYLVVGDAHVIQVLAPITACALLYGTIPASVVGAVSGLAELVHAELLPLDYYEKYFIAPWNSVLLFALVGLVAGLLFAWVDRSRETTGWRRPACLTLCCALCSALFTVLFHQSSYFINTVLVAMEVPASLLAEFTEARGVLLQWLMDAVMMTVLSLASDKVNQRRIERSHELSIKEAFQGWLAVVVFVAYLVCGALAYTAISATCRADAEETMRGRIEYLSGQLEDRNKMIDAVARRTHASERALEEAYRASVSDIATGINFDFAGVTVVAEDGTIVSSSEPTYLGRSFEEVVGAGLRNGFDDALYDATVSCEWDMGGGSLAYARMAELGYMRMVQKGTYQLMVAIPAHEVFWYRPGAMVAVSLAFVMVFAALFAQASILLQNVVVRGFDETNATLSRITDGDLSQVVDVHDSIEFTNLSGGINATVDALKDSIAEAEARIARELMTAKAIQESALPRTFPPFPQIDAFDIFASMNPAKEVGGDFYDFFLIDDHTLGFFIADVSGKGIPAALFMMAAKSELDNYMASGQDLASAIQSVNYHLCQGNDTGMFVTVWAATLDYETGVLTYVNAGHNPPLLRHGGTWRWLRERGGLFLGSFDIATYSSQCIRLVPGDALVMYTDGVTEAFSVDESQYGEARLERYLMEHREEHPHTLVDGVRSDVARWADGAEQSDDITLLALEYGVAPEVTGSMTVPARLESLERVMSFVHAELGRRLCPISVQNQLDIALEELFVNICLYAYEDDDPAPNVTVEYFYYATPHSMTIQLTDHGVPFNPLDHDDPERATSVEEATIGGLGILMAKKVSDDISYIRDNDSNVIAFKKAW